MIRQRKGFKGFPQSFQTRESLPFFLISKDYYHKKKLLSINNSALPPSFFIFSF